MAVGERRNHSYQDANVYTALVAALNMIQQQQQPASLKTKHGNYAGDEQTVPKSYRQQNADNLQQDYLHDPLTSYGQWYNNSTYPLNHNVTAYPSLQHGLNNASPAAQGTKDPHVPSVARQISIPNGTELLEQYINNNNNSGFDYDQVLDNIDCNEYVNISDNFSLEDYVDLEKVHFPEDDNLNFNVGVKQEKPDDNGNVDKLDMMMNNAEMNPNNNNEWSLYNNYPENMTVPTATGSDQTLEDPNNVNFSNFMGGYYSSPQLGSLSQPSTVSEQIVVKAEPDEMVQRQCELIFQQQQQDDSYNGASSGLPLPNDELIEMPVSRFNEFITSLTQEQCNIAKDVRRRGKNKKAARLCRKRKIDNISTLEETLTELEEKKIRLLEERKEIVSETDELKRNIDSVCEILIKGLNSENVISSSDISVLHHSKGHTLLVRE